MNSIKASSTMSPRTINSTNKHLIKTKTGVEENTAVYNAYRRRFLQRILFLPSLNLFAHNTHTQPAPALYLMTQFHVAELAYDTARHVIQHLRTGDELCLVAEPTNPHDEFAVEIFYGECKLGYVPRSDNHHLSRLLQQGATLTCKVLEVDPNVTVWDTVRAQVFLTT
jgi:hypothetical protein